MNIIMLLIFISLSIATVFLLIFLWNLKSGQYDDMHSPSVRILFGDKVDKKEVQKVSTNARLAEEKESDDDIAIDNQ